MSVNIKFIFMSIIVFGLIFSTASVSDLAFADKPNDGDQRNAKTDREIERADAKTDRKNVEEFNGDVVVTSSSTTTICHIPPGNNENAHEISIGVPAVNAHLAHGDNLGSCPSGIEEFNGDVNKIESNAAENNENLIENLTRQIANLEKSLQNFLDQFLI